MFADQKELLDETDRALARAAIYEGDATSLMVLWAGSNLTPEEFADVQAAGADPESMAILARTPAILVESLLFPYTAGQAFVLPVQTAGGWDAVDALYDELPARPSRSSIPTSTERARSPSRSSCPTTLAAEMGDGWTESIQDTFGEFQIGVWLRQSGISASDASAAAAGWGGDRLAVLDGPGEAWAVVMRTTWDTDEDATAFRAGGRRRGRRAGRAAGTVIADGRDITVVVRVGRRHPRPRGRGGGLPPASADCRVAPPTSTRARRSPAARASARA